MHLGSSSNPTASKQSRGYNVHLSEEIHKEILYHSISFVIFRHLLHHYLIPYFTISLYDIYGDLAQKILPSNQSNLGAKRQEKNQSKLSPLETQKCSTGRGLLWSHCSRNCRVKAPALARRFLVTPLTEKENDRTPYQAVVDQPHVYRTRFESH